MNVFNKRTFLKQAFLICFLAFLWLISLVISTYANGVQNTFGHDAMEGLDAEQRQSTSTLAAGGTLPNTARTIWSYDKVGNRLTQAVSSYDGIGINSPSILKSTFNTGYNYNINDWLTKTTSTRHDDTGDSTFVTHFEYNANGSQSAVTRNVGTPDEKHTPYFYDFEEKLTAIGNPADTTRHAYWYDADGNRIAESNTNSSGTDVQNYLVDPNNSNAQIVEEYNNANTLLAHYDWNDDELLREASRNADESTFTIREPLADGHNSIRQLLDETGAISNIYAFDAWGNQQVNTGGSFNPYRYNSQRLDASGLYNLRARQYSSGIGRFLTHDPLMGDISDPISQHRYLYVNDDPINFIDPSGAESLAEIQFSISTQITTAANFTTKAISVYDKVNSVVNGIQTAQAIFNVLRDPTSLGTLTESINNFPSAFRDYEQTALNFTASDVLDSLEENLPEVLGHGVGPWSQSLAKSYLKGNRIKAFLIYMPNPIETKVARHISTPVKIDEIPIELVFGGKGSGRIIGLGVRTNQDNQLFRVDFGLLNPNHGHGKSSTGDLIPLGNGAMRKSNEIAAWNDQIFHYHVLRF